MPKPVSGTLIESTSPYASGIAAAYILNEGSGTAVNDSSGNSNTLAFSATQPTWTTAGGEGGLSFSGTSDVARMASTPSGSSLYLSGSSFTLVARVFDPTTPQPDGAVFGKVTSAFHYQIGIDSGAQQITTLLTTTSGSFAVVGPASSVGGGLDSMHGQMNTIAVRGNGSHVSIWLNGSKLNEVAETGTLVPNTDGFALGARGENASSEYNGFLSAAWVWNRALTDAELGSIHTDPWAMYTSASTPLAAGTASFVKSGPSGILISATDATDGTAPYTYQWQRNEDGGSYTNLTDGSGVSGATTLNLTDGSAVEGVLYGYKLVYTDDVSDTATSNSVTAQVYPGGTFGALTVYYYSQ